MRQVPDWDEYFMRMAHNAATRSKDDSTQVGVVVVRGKDIVISGYNGFPPGLLDTEERWERPQKYDNVIHAEVNAVARAAKLGLSLEGCTLYCTHHPCLNCAKTIIAAGISTVYCGFIPQGWEEDCAKAQKILMDSGVLCIVRSELEPEA